MGSYDIIKGHVVCPYCGGVTEVEDQIKLVARDSRRLNIYGLHDTIHLRDGEYFWGSTTRDSLLSKCNYCKTMLYFGFTVKDSEITDIYSLNDDTREKFDKDAHIIWLKDEYNDCILKLSNVIDSKDETIAELAAKLEQANNTINILKTKMTEIKLDVMGLTKSIIYNTDF